MQHKIKHRGREVYRVGVMGSAKIMAGIGKGFAEAMLELEK